MDTPDSADVAAFVQTALPGLSRFALMLTGDPELARDLLQDVMEKVCAHWDRVVSADHPDHYVKAIMTKTHLSWRRRWSVRHIHLSAAGDVESPTAPDHAVSVVDHDFVWHHLAGLPRQQRAVVVLRFYEHLTDPEIADILGCRPGTVRGYASRALATLRAELGSKPLEVSKEMP